MSNKRFAVFCGFLLVGCGSDSPNPSGESDAGTLTASATDSVSGGDTDADSDAPVDDDFDPGYTDGDPPDTGADDSAGQPEVCDDEAPDGFEIPIDESCETEPAVGMFTPLVEWHKGAWIDIPNSDQSVTTPIVVQLSDDDGDGDIDNDDTPDIAFVTYNSQGVLRAISGDGSSEILSVPVPGFNRQTGISAADIDGDGVVEIIGINNGGQVIAFEHTGVIKWTSAALGGDVVTHDNTAAISDMDGDGRPEIIAGRAILDADGVVIGAGEFGRGSAAANGALSFAVDVDGDGTQEVVVGNALYRMDGSAIWNNDESDGFPAIADFDLDLVPEIVVVNAGLVRLQSSVTGAVQWTSPIPGGNGGPPTVADFDGDGFPEIGVAGASSYTVFEGDGTQVWTNVTQDLSSGITGSSVFDFEGDGVADVVYADEATLWVYSGHDGSVKLEFDQHTSGTRIEYPVVADVDGDGEVEIAFVNEVYQGDVRGLTVVGDANHSWQPGRKIWNQHAYYITNVADDGGVPAVPAPNWASYNNFRSGHTGPNDGLAIPSVELFGDVCQLGCDETGLRAVFVQIGNGGAGQLTTSVDVQVFGLDEAGDEVLIDTVTFQPPLDAGVVTAGQQVDVDPEQFTQIRAQAVAQEVLCDAEGMDFEVSIEPCADPPAPAG